MSLEPGENGLPPVTCTGFQWAEFFAPYHHPDPADTVTLDMAIIPFRSGFTDVLLPGLMRLRFSDGLVNGLPYNRSVWNDVRVQLRPATQDYMLTVNGVQAGPSANEFPCEQPGGCLTLDAFALRGGVFEESVAWIDTLSLVRESAAGPEPLLEVTFDTCSAPQNVFLGGVLISEPPRRTCPGCCGR